MEPKILTPLDVPSTANANQYSTSSFSAAAGSFALAFVANIRDGGGVANIPTAQSNNLTWTQIATIQLPNAVNRRLTCFSARAPAPGVLTFSFAGQRQTDCAWSVFAFDGVDAVNAVLQPQAVTGNSQSILHTLGALSNPATSAVVGGVFVSGNVSIGQGPGAKEIYDRFLDTRATLETQHATGNPAVAWALSTAADYAAILLEIKAAQVVGAQPSVAETEILARRFEPILFFHPQEKFFPSDAKRYIERSALWNAKSPFDNKGSWTSIIKPGEMAALGGEPGKFLGSNLLVNSPDDQFFELTGWKKADGTPQPEVTDQSENTYSNRDRIAALYNNNDNGGGAAKLRDSKYWYHVEFLGSDRLRQLLGTVHAPDLVKVLDSRKNAALLNYYFFFPAREEILAGECTNIEATEFGCFGGAWSCMSLLLERDDPTATFGPTFIGHSGRWSSEQDGSPVPAQAADQDDQARRLVMKVNRFNMTEREFEHPRLFVAKGTHSLYLNPGTHDDVTYQPGLHPGTCGRFETVAMEPENPEQLEELLALIAKMLAGAALFSWGNLAGLGAVAGFLWAAQELRTEDYISTGYPPDETGSRLSSIMVVPRDAQIAIPPEAARIEEWRSAQGVEIDGRRYDYLVDRATQVWWPREDIDEQGPGYRGRWGPLVEGDPLGRRSGMKFPPFWRMFFMALAGQQAE